MFIQPAYRRTKMQEPDDWDQLANGQMIQSCVQQQLDDSRKHCLNGTTVTLGNLAQQLDVSGFTLGRPIHICQIQKPAEKCHGVRAHYTQLPIKNESVDTLVCPFVLDFSADPHQVLREALRVLADDGTLILAGFNPLSPAMLSGLWRSQRWSFPWQGRYFSQARVKDWLSLLGFRVERQRYFIGHFLAKQDAEFGGYSEWLCQRCSWLSAGYWLVVKKSCYIKPQVNKSRKERLSLTQALPAARVKQSANWHFEER
ncbi:methyltransferase domain-containing protein [Idiomarina baltica]|uniref:class I SAM-dependent methyltransferase n=1 Tax=Idiomarina baltica TaxID=190892 RepID=UPI000C36092F|nr:methyltransferase domain-containing protein [Idiomarina baltica]MAF74307.1 hypothetical protein [Idiomarinaceae bacterium]MBL75202.1 hypothetical protein [Idiomarinaceae bacterium]MEC8925675.1 methyltransferase domain-containing protein [Pseudomonadota bacterium]